MRVVSKRLVQTGWGKWMFFGLVSLLFASPGLVQASSKVDGLQSLNVAASSHGGSARVVQARVLIDAPPSLVWETLTDYRNIKNTLPGYEKSTVLQSRGATKLLDLAMRVAAFLPSYKYQVLAKEDEGNYHLQLSRVSGDFKSLSASYKLSPQNNGSKTLLVYRLDIDPGFNAPGAQGLIKSSSEKTLRALENCAEREARKSLIGQR